MTTAVKRACDACHRRKVKCDGVNPCRNCASAQLSCTYNAIPQKKGPKGSRAKVISELRETQRQTTISVKAQNRIISGNTPPSNPSFAPTPGLLTPEMAKECVEFFFANMYPTMPILHRQRLEQQAMYMDQSLDTYCLLSSLCAFMMLQPGMGLPGSDPYGFDSMPGANIVSGTLLMEETIRVRKGYDYLDSPSLNSLCTSFFLFGCYYGLDMHDKAWFHLREATTLAHMIGMNKEETYLQFDGIESSRRRRLYWLLFVTERAYALQRQRPLTLQATINPPTPSDDPTDPLASNLNGFLLLVNLFRPFDDAFTALWNKTRGDCSPTYLSALQKQLGEVLPAYLNVTDSSASDIQANQQWLKNMTWQINMANGGLTSNGNDPAMAFHFPVDMQRDLLTMVSHFSSDSLGLLGIGLMEKLFDISCSLTDVLSLLPASRDPFTIGPREHLNQLLNILTVLRNGDHRFLPLLLSKVNEVLPRLANPMLQNAPENACNIDIFDGFGNAGMAQPPVLPMEEYESKFAIARIEDMNTDSGSTNAGPSTTNDISSPFVSSPSIMSPGTEFSHGLHTDFNSMQEMVMSPIGPGPGSSFNAPPSMNTQQPQHQSQHHQPQHHQPHHSISGLPTLGSQLNSQIQAVRNSGLNPPPNITLPTQSLNQGQGLGQTISQGMNQGMNTSLNSAMAMNANNMVHRPGPQRANSFAIPSQQIRTVGDFHALQRANSDMSTIGSLGLAPMSTEMDFNTLR